MVSEKLARPVGICPRCRAAVRSFDEIGNGGSPALVNVHHAAQLATPPLTQVRAYKLDEPPEDCGEEPQDN